MKDGSEGMHLLKKTVCKIEDDKMTGGRDEKELRLQQGIDGSGRRNWDEGNVGLLVGTARPMFTELRRVKNGLARHRFLFGDTLARHHVTARCRKETVHSLLLSNGNLIRSLLKTARRSCAFSSMEDPRIA